jgi:hypothetical protein
MNGPRADAAAPTGKPATPQAANRPDHPPKPRFALAIGVVGHRLEHWDDSAEQTDGRQSRSERLQKIAGAVHVALKAIKDAAIKAYDDHKNLFDEDPADAKQRAPELTLVSSLADGADTIAAKAALALGYAVDAPLPFAAADYEKDFSAVAVDEHTPAPLQEFRALVKNARSVLPLPGQRGSAADTEEQGGLKQNRAYEAVGFTVLSQADILLAVWDGKPPRGRGGTAQMVAEAVRQRIPIIHVDANGESEPRILGDDELFVAVDAAEDFTPIALDSGLAKLIDDLVRPPAEVPRKGEQRGLIERCAPAWSSETDALKEFLGNHFRQRNLRPEFPIMLAMAGVRKCRPTDYRPNTPAELADGYMALSQSASDCDPCAAKILAEAYGWADVIGIRFAQVFRSAVVANFTLAACTIILAASSVAFAPEKKIIFVAAELILIGLILFNTVRGWWIGWHRRWFEAREVAERLRTALALWALGIRPAAFFGQEPTWTGWYARAIVRSQGMRDARQNPDWLAEAHSTLQKVLDDQCAYHGKSAEQMGKLERRLELSGLILFGVTFLLALAFLAYLLKSSAPHGPNIVIVTAFSASLPALASALYAIRIIGDFGGIARRSERTLVALKTLRKAAERDADDLRALRVHARAAAEVMLGDVASWRLATESRALDIP